MKKEEKIVGELTAEEIGKLKKQHKIEAVIGIPFKGRIAYIKEPKRNELDYALTQAQEGPLKMVDAILETCWVGGDETLKEDHKFIASMMGKTDEILGISSLTLKNL